MSGPDLTAAVEAFRAGFGAAMDRGANYDAQMLAGMTAASAEIEAAVRDQVAQEIHADGHDRGCDSFRSDDHECTCAADDCARIARGGQS